MTSISFAGIPEPVRGSTAASHSANAPQQAHNNLNSAANSDSGQHSNSTNSAFRNNDNSIFHAHRQNHNSSKLPAFRFADLKREPITLPSLLQQTGAQPSPVSALTINNNAHNSPSENQENAHEQLEPSQQTRPSPGSARETLHHFSSAQNLSSDKPVAFETIAQNLQQQHGIPRIRSLKFQLSSPTATVTATSSSGRNPATGSKRPASFPDTPRVIGNVYATKSQLAYVATPVTKRRLTASTTALQDAAAPPSRRPSLSSARLQTTETDDIGGHVPESATKEWTQDQRDLPQPKTTTVDIASTDEKKLSRPPVSYKQILVPSASSALSTTSTAPNGRAVIRPIRNFRSSRSRKSLVLDMPGRRFADEYGDELSSPNQRDRTLRALEGRDEDLSHPLETGDMTTTTDNDNTADIFMKIAGEATARRSQEGRGKADDQSTVSRITRISHRRPLSTAVANFRASSPPQLTRRLSDQRDTTRTTRQRAESQSAQQITRELNYRTSREKPAPIATANTDDSSSTRTVSIRTPLKPSPITPRSIQFQDSSSESYQRRRQSVTENNHVTSARTAPQYRSSNLAQSRIYNSSPLVPKSVNSQKDDAGQNGETHQAAEGTESSSSTAAPSTVWDELDDLKSRINRLEITGKMPSTSGAAMSRISDDRPPTANTNATTMSASPKRGSEAKATRGDAVSTTSSHREAQPLLLSALQKTKGFVSSEVFGAMESAANDALALSTMIGAPGQPGPISSAASSIGFGGGVTDRQLRRKADSVCRSLTELCIALADELSQTKQANSSFTREDDLLMSPTSRRPAAAIAAAASTSRRPSAIADTIIPSQPLQPKSPRAPTSLETKRQTLLASTAVSSPRYANAPVTPVEPLSAGRKSSLLLSRTRRAGTEEPEEPSGRRSSLLLRTRRAGTEEPEEIPQGRKTSLLLRTRKTMNEDEDESRFRTPSRAVTEVNSFRAVPREVRSTARSPPDVEPQVVQSALPRRRLIPSSLQSRLVIPASSNPTTPVPRRYLERVTVNGDGSSLAEKLAEERAQRLSIGQTSLLNRSSSLHRRSRESHIPSLQSQQQNTASANGYR